MATMRLDQNPVYRKAIYPWYDSDAACYILLVFLLSVLLFGIAGISVSRETSEYHAYIWVPGILVFLSSLVVLSLSIRLVKRYIDRIDRFSK